MEYKRLDNVIFARIDKGEEIIEKVKEIAEKEKIKLAGVQALGAVDHFSIGLFKTKEKQYLINEFEGNYEIASLAGTINTMDDQFYCHLHMCAGNEKGEAFGGHLSRALVNPTCEMVIQIFDGKVDREFNEEAGLNLFKF